MTYNFFFLGKLCYENLFLAKIVIFIIREISKIIIGIFLDLFNKLSLLSPYSKYREIHTNLLLCCP